MTALTHETYAAPVNYVKYCEKGGQLNAELHQHEDAIRDAQRAMREDSDIEDSIGRRVPRSLHDTLRSRMNQRALSRMQWTRHVEKCWDCTLASNRAARPSRPAGIAA